MEASTNSGLYPLLFNPILKERVWGGRKLEQLYHKPLPTGVPVGESWEISDRPGDSSVVRNGPHAGKDLHWLMQTYGKALLGRNGSHSGTFPLLVKILDAQEKLSLQVHPPRQKAAGLGGEPKTEMWYIAQAEPGAELYVGLKEGVTRAEFETKIKTGAVAECFHRIKVTTGDAMFLPSGRIHALGAGLVIFEIQQNSDTTYRVFDWNRNGLDGKPRALHIRESLASIDFNDFEPSLVQTQFEVNQNTKVRKLVSNPLFDVDICQADQGANIVIPARRMQIIGVLTGRLDLQYGQTVASLSPGDFCLIPACLEGVTLHPASVASFLRTGSGAG